MIIMMEDVDVEEKTPENQNDNHVVTSEQEEKPLNSRLDCSESTDTKTPEPDVENSLAFSTERRSSIKRHRRYLPANEPDVVTDYTPLEDLMSDTPPLAAFLRNVLVTAVVDEAEKERKLQKSVEPNDEQTGKLTMDDLSISSGGTEQYEHLDMWTPVLRQARLFDGKCTKSEPCLSDYPSNQDDDDNRTMSAPVQINMEFANRYTQTEWSWLEDMKKCEDLRLQLESSLHKSKDESKDGHMTDESRNDDDFNQNEEPVDGLFKDPTIEVSSESSSEDEEDILISLNDQYVLPSVGPPKILQYIKESANPPCTNYDDNQTADKSVGRPVTTASIDVANLPQSTGSKSKIMGTGILQEEQKESSAEDQEVTDESGEPTVSAHDEILKQLSIYNDEGDISDKIIDIKPHPPFGTKAARKAAKERAAERAREREIERQKVSGNTVNFYAMTRQMKTLAYSLASTKCMDDGWTVKRPLSPSEAESEDTLDPFDIKINSSITQQKETFFERFYTNGKRLLVIFPNGTGCCYYPTGNPAVIISSTEKGKYSYIIQEDTHEHSRSHTGILGVFEPTGHGCCYFQTSNVLRMVLTPYGGTYFDNKGLKKKKWWWYNNQNHVHAPPFQPITFAMTKELSIRCMGQDNVIVTYNYGRHTIRFNVGANLTIAKKIDQPLRCEDYEIHLKETKQFVNLVIERIRSTLRFPHSSTRINRLPLQKPQGLQRISRRRERKILFDKEDTAAVIVN